MADEALTLTPEDIDSFMRYRSEQGGTVDSNKAYLRAMRHFYKDLQELGGRIEAGTLGLWRDLQLDRGYSPNTISAEISVVNSYLKYIGRRDLQLEPGLQLRKRERPPHERVGQHTDVLPRGWSAGEQGQSAQPARAVPGHPGRDTRETGGARRKNL